MYRGTLEGSAPEEEDQEGKDDRGAGDQMEDNGREGVEVWDVRVVV